MGRDPGNMADVQVCGTGTHQVLVKRFQYYGLVHHRNGEHCKLCLESARQDRGLILAPKPCCDRSNRMLFWPWLGNV
jgi:hypothetical protein